MWGTVCLCSLVKVEQRLQMTCLSSVSWIIGNSGKFWSLKYTRNNLKICDRRCDKWWMEREPLLNLIRICCQQVRKYFTVFYQYKILKRGSWSCRVWICVEKRVIVLISFGIKTIWLRLNLNYKLPKILCNISNQDLELGMFY